MLSLSPIMLLAQGLALFCLFEHFESLECNLNCELLEREDCLPQFLNHLCSFSGVSSALCDR